MAGPVLPPDWREEEEFQPGLWGALEQPGVLSLPFTDYPDTVFHPSQSVGQENVEQR